MPNWLDLCLNFYVLFSPFIPLIQMVSCGQGGILAMFPYGGVRAMFMSLKFHLKAIFLGLKFANLKFPFFGG